MQHKMSMAYMSEYTHNKACSFINCHQSIRMIIPKPFHDSQWCRWQTKQIISPVKPGFWSIFHKCGSCSLKHIQYRQIFWNHVKEETYPHVWKCPENMLKYLYGGTFEKCKLFLRRTVCSFNMKAFHHLFICLSNLYVSLFSFCI